MTTQHHTLFGTIKKVFSVLNSAERNRCLMLVIFMIFCSLFEFISVGSIFPYIKIITDPSIIHKNSKLESVYNFFNFTSNYGFIIFLGCLFMIIVLAKAAVGILNNYFQATFSENIKKRIAITLFENYLLMPMLKIYKEKTTFFGKHLLSDVENFFAVINGLLMMITNVMMMSALIILMFLVSSTALLISLVLLGALVIISIKATKKRNEKVGKASEKTYRYLYRNVDEALKGVKDIKIFCKEKYFVNEFSRLQGELKNQRISLTVISSIPTVLINALGFSVMLGILLVSLLIYGNIISLLPSLGVVAICIQRLLPGMTLATTNFGTIRTYNVIIFKLVDLLNKTKDFSSVHDKQNTLLAKRLHFEESLVFDDVSFSYEKDNNYVLNDVNLKIKKNSITGIIGKSGSGKSTLMDVLMGFYPITKGQLLCDGNPVKYSFLHEYAGCIAYVSQKPFILDATLKQNIAFGECKEEVDLEKIKIAIEVAQLSDLVNAFEHGIDEELGEDAIKISGGQKQRIGIARAIYSNADILILDESTSALDVDTERAFYAALKGWASFRKTVIIISHRNTLLDYCDRVILVQDGKINELESNTHQSEIILAGAGIN